MNDELKVFYRDPEPARDENLIMFLDPNDGAVPRSTAIHVPLYNTLKPFFDLKRD